MAEYVDDEELPVFLGGTKEDNGMICAALPVPGDGLPGMPEGEPSPEVATTAAEDATPAEEEKNSSWFGSSKFRCAMQPAVAAKSERSFL